MTPRHRKNRLRLPGEPTRTTEHRILLAALIALLIAAAVLLLTQQAHSAELSLCYDESRWPEAARVANRKGTVVLNPDSGRGSPETAAKWDAFGKRLRSVGGRSLGYVDYLDESSRRKLDDKVIAEALRWLKTGHTGIWLDDARDTAADAAVIIGIKRVYSTAVIIANPGTRCSGPLKRSGAILCEHESNKTINWESQVIIAFVDNTREAQAVRSQAAQKKGLLLLAIEPLSTYHVLGVEYQKPNPFTP